MQNANKQIFPLRGIKAALIDMDGTLYDSMPHHADAWKQMADENGIPSDRYEFFLFEGSTGSSVINILFNRTYGHGATEEEVKRLYGRKSDIFRSLPPVSPMPGAKDMLDILRHAGIKRVLVTGSGQNSLISRLNTDFPGAFRDELRITAANTEHSKPHPDPYLKAMALAYAEPQQCIAFENAPMGIESAHRSGAFTIGVATGPIPESVLAEAGADITFPSMEACAQALPKILGL